MLSKCQFCGRKLRYNGRGAPKKFCGAPCRQKANYQNNREVILERARHDYEAKAEHYREIARIRRRRKLNQPMAPAEAGYVAGLIDGEGTISITRRKHRSNGRYNHNYVVYALIVNTDRRMLERARELIDGGTIQKHTEVRPERIARLGRTKPVYRLYMNPNIVRWLLPQVIPHLITKRPQAELALEVSDVVRNQQGRLRDDKFVNAMESYVRRFREMHGKKYIPIQELAS